MDRDGHLRLHTWSGRSKRQSRVIFLLAELFTVVVATAVLRGRITRFSGLFTSYGIDLRVCRDSSDVRFANGLGNFFCLCIG